MWGTIIALSAIGRIFVPNNLRNTGDTRGKRYEIMNEEHIQLVKEYNKLVEENAKLVEENTKTSEDMTKLIKEQSKARKDMTKLIKEQSKAHKNVEETNIILVGLIFGAILMTIF
jgi:histidinol phosphatase-like PHP family hydrolase